MEGKGTRRSRRRLPIGLQTFRKLREENCYYVDKTGFIARLLDEGTHYFLCLRVPGVRADFARVTGAKWGGRPGKLRHGAVAPAQFCRSGGTGSAVWRGGAQGVPAAHFHPAVGAAFSSARRRSRTWRAAPGGVRFPGGGPWRRGWPAGVRRVARLRVPSPGPRCGPSSGPAPRSASPFSFEVFDAPHVPGIPLRTKPHRTAPVIAPARHTSRIGAWSPYLHTLSWISRPTR